MNVWGVILAAGESRRFGRDKLTVPLDGAPLVEAVLSVVARAREAGVLREGLIVVRDQGSEVARRAAEHRIQILVNPNAAAGMGTSLRTGLVGVERSDRQSEGAIVLLADQPLVTVEAIRSLLSAAAASGADVVRPRYDANPMVPGHPVFLRKSTWSLAADLDGDTGLQRLIESSSVVVETLPIAGSNPDIDTLQDLDALQVASPDA